MQIIVRHLTFKKSSAIINKHGGKMKDKILYELKSLECEIVNKINKTNKKIPLGLTQIKIIEYLKNNDPVYQKDLEKNLGISRATISCVLKTMEKNKILERKLSPKDARIKKIILNSEIRNELDNNVKKIKELEKKIVANIDEDDLHIFFNVLTKIKQNLKEEK